MVNGQKIEWNAKQNAKLMVHAWALGIAMRVALFVIVTVWNQCLQSYGIQIMYFIGNRVSLNSNFIGK